MNKSIKIFIEFVELRTKVASFFPMVIGFLWTVYYYKQFNLLNALLFFVAVITFDMCTTAINNTMDYHKAIDLDYKANENVIGVHQLSLKRMVGIIFVLLGISLIFSISLVFLTDPVLLLMGALCFLIGICYTFGPMPLSRLPLGEIFSGVTMGFGILFLSVYITQFQTLLTSEWTTDLLTFQLKWVEIVRIAWWSIPLVCLIATIMLANNICDLKTDIANQRHTLVYYIGVQNAVRLYIVLSILPWLGWLSYILLGALPTWAGLAFIILPLHFKSIRRFTQKQIKKETFVESVKSFVLFSCTYLLTLILSILISK